MPTKVRFFLLRSCEALPILRETPINSPFLSSTVSASLRQRELMGVFIDPSPKPRIVEEKFDNEHFILTVHEKQVNTMDEAINFLLETYQKDGAPSDQDVLLFLGSFNPDDSKLHTILCRHILFWEEIKLSDCNRCLNRSCKHRELTQHFKTFYNGLLMSAKSFKSPELRSTCLTAQRWSGGMKSERGTGRRMIVKMMCMYLKSKLRTLLGV